MKRCPVTRFPITENPEWILPHADNGYCTVFSIIGNDIIHFVHRSETDTITLADIDSLKFQALLKRFDLAEKKLFMLANLEKVTEFGHRYRKDFLNFIFNRGTNIRLIVLYNINDKIRSDIERVRQIAPQQTRLTCEGSYSEAMDIVINHKKSDLPTTPVMYLPSDTNGNDKNLAAGYPEPARISAITRSGIIPLLHRPGSIPKGYGNKRTDVQGEAKKPAENR